MPTGGLSETGQVVAAIATAVILAVLAKYGLAPDEGGGDGKNVPIVINNYVGVAEAAAKQGKDDTQPSVETPASKPYKDITTGVLPIQINGKRIASGLLEYRKEGTICLAVTMDSAYGNVVIAVWGKGFGLDPKNRATEEWHEMDWEFVGGGTWLVHIPSRWDRDGWQEGKLSGLMILCNSVDATRPVDPADAQLYCDVATAKREYRLNGDRTVALFDNDGNPRRDRSINHMNSADAEKYVPGIAIPYVEVHLVTPDKK